MTEMNLVLKAEADASVVSASDLCGEVVTWDNDGETRSGLCTFHKDHEPGEHSRP